MIISLSLLLLHWVKNGVDEQEAALHIFSVPLMPQVGE